MFGDGRSPGRPPEQRRSAMEYEDLVNYYREKLLEKYQARLSSPEMKEIKEKIEQADAETRRQVLDLLNKKL